MNTLYTTKYGLTSVATMLAELKVAEWPPAWEDEPPSEADIVAKYAALTGSPVTLIGGTTPPTGETTPPTGETTWDEWLKGFLYEYEPAYRGAYGGWSQNIPQSASQKNWLEEQYTPYRNKYLTSVYPQIKAGVTPTVTFEEFLKTLSPMADFWSLPYSERGEKPAIMSPFAKMLLR